MEEDDPRAEDIDAGERAAAAAVDDEEEVGDDEYEEEEYEEEEEDETESDIDKKKRDPERNYMLDLDENNVTVERHNPGSKFKRLKKAGRETEAHENAELRRKEVSGAADSDGWGEKGMEHEFEHDRIRDTDVPERIQLTEDVTGPPPTDDKTSEEESSWIYDQLTDRHNSPLSGHAEIFYQFEKEDIARFLTLLHRSKFDVPFIAMYRKESCSSLLKEPEIHALESDETKPKMKWHKVLWAVHNLDRRWLLIQKRKTALKAYYSKRFKEETQRIDDVTLLSLNKKLFSSIVKAIEDAKSEREVDDADAKFNLHFPPKEVDVECGRLKSPKLRSLYSAFYKSGLWEVTNKFGHSSEKSAEFLSFRTMINQELEGKGTPEEAATDFTHAMFKTPQDVLKGARHMAAMEIWCEPLTKKYVRGIFMEKAVVSTTPTPKGNSSIDAYHQLADVKWLCYKPLNTFEGAQWMLIQKGEEEKLLQVSISLPETVQIELLEEANRYYLSEGVNLIANAWNEHHRKLILEDAFNNFIFPSMEKEVRSLLTSRAKNWLLMEYGKQLWNRVSAAPYKPEDADSDYRDEYESRVLVCCWGPGKPESTFVMLDSAGEMVDVLHAGLIGVRPRPRPRAVSEQLKSDCQRASKFITDHCPHVICVGAANMQCRFLKDDIYEVLFYIIETIPSNDNIFDNINNVKVFYADESLPRLYENSQISLDQLPGQPGIVKRAVALGRYLQNPLAMIATLCGPGKEILSWKLLPLEHFLTPDEKYEMVEQVMVDATNQVGLDINLAASHEWMFAPLQFISGLGPRKASALQKACVRKGLISDRREIPIARNHHPKVYQNATGFLRVRRSGAASYSDAFKDLLDDTRINPESYMLAKYVAMNLYAHHKKCEPSELDEDTRAIVIELVRDNSNAIESLKIDEYTHDFISRFGAGRSETLRDIDMELRHGFQDWRTPFRQPSYEEEFDMLSGETEETLTAGRTVQVTVLYVLKKHAMCLLNSGLRGLIMAKDFSDDGYGIDKVRKGDVITCKIKHINKYKMLVYLTFSKETDMRRGLHVNMKGNRIHFLKKMR